MKPVPGLFLVHCCSAFPGVVSLPSLAPWTGFQGGIEVYPLLTRKVKGRLLFQVTVLREDIAQELRNYFHFSTWETTQDEMQGFTFDVGRVFHRGSGMYDVTHNGLILNQGVARTAMCSALNGLPHSPATDSVGYRYMCVAE